MRKTQLIEIPLRDGIVTNESPYAIGPRLLHSQNSVWNYPWPRSAALNPTAWLLRQPLTFPYRAPLSFTGLKSFRDIGFCRNVNSPPFAASVALIGCNTSNQYALWGDQAGAEVAFAGGVPRVGPSAAARRLGCSAYWSHPGNDPASGSPTTDAMLVFSHPEISEVYYLFDASSAIRSLHTDTANCPAGAAALAVHLDRLWLLTGNPTTSPPAASQLWYTDPFNADSIRTTNVLQVTGVGTCLIPGQYGAIDTSGVPHLVIGTATAIYVLDGDPQLGGGTQADLRVLSEGLGMASSHVAAVTPYGVFFLGTDGNLWMIPLGSQTVTRVGDPIANVLGTNNATGVIDLGATATGSVVWFHPYLYIFPGGETSAYYLAEPTAQGIARFWGPMGVDQVQMRPREAVIRAPREHFGYHAPSGEQVPSVHSVETLPVAGVTARYLAFDALTQQTGSYPNGSNTNRTVDLSTGFINQPGHRVIPRRVILEVMPVPALGTGPVAWTVTVIDEYGRPYLANLLPETTPAAGTGTNSRLVTTLHYAVPAMSDPSIPTPACRAFAIAIGMAFPSSNLALHRVLVEYAVAPEQF